jgi:hypothetical protein
MVGIRLIQYVREIEPHVRTSEEKNNLKPLLLYLKYFSFRFSVTNYEQTMVNSLEFKSILSRQSNLNDKKSYFNLQSILHQSLTD